jgi:uncharacterized protein with von Willebrand factor type A (vWA) domain
MTSADARDLLPSRLVRLARLLRMQGMATGTGTLVRAVEALALTDVTDRLEVYWTLRAVFVHAPEEIASFDLAFGHVWRGTRGARAFPAADAPDARENESEAERLATEGKGGIPRDVVVGNAESGSVAGAAEPGYSPDEVLRKKDFGEMTADELTAARRMVARIHVALAPLPTRRFRSDPHGERVDPRATLRASVRAGPSWIPLRFRGRRIRPRPVLALCDISGSMRAYAPMILQFLHALTCGRDHVHTFLFGTRLTNATPYLRRRHGAEAMRRLGDAVMDWEGGTRIGPSLAAFNRAWGRRLLGRNAVVLLITDGLDRAEGEELEPAMRRLRASCGRLIWLNPLLRFEDFEPLARGIRAILPHVDDLQSIHDVASLQSLAELLEDPARRARRRAS